MNTKWTVRKLIQNTYQNMHSRFDYMDRDVLKNISVQMVTVYDPKNLGKPSKTKYIIKSFSYPQYYPYYTGKDNRGRPIKYQRTYKHEYSVTIEMKTLSLDETDIKFRTGADAKWDFSKTGKGYWKGEGRNRKFIEGSNIRRGINGDFFFRNEWVYSQNEILFGRNWTSGPPQKTNPKQIVFLDKHLLSVLKILIDRRVIQ